MKKLNIFLLLFVTVVLLSVTTLGQLNPINNATTKVTQVTSTINVTQQETCTTIFYDEVKPLMGNCPYYTNYTLCLNITGPNTDCSLQQAQVNVSCITGQANVTKNTTECRLSNNLIISLKRGNSVLKKQLDFSEWGACIYEEQNNCLLVTCQSRYDGANDGKFHGCRSGTSCQKFEICDNSTKISYKNSRDDFVEEDPTFNLGKLPLAEVTE